MTKLCGECRYLDSEDLLNGRAYCTEKCERRFADSDEAEKCSKFFGVSWGDTYRAKEVIRAAERYRKENESTYRATGCFITTAVVNILGLADNCEELMILRKFRAQILQNNPEYKNILLKYDTIGPVISRALIHDDNREQVAIDLYRIYIKGCISYIKNNYIDLAINLYTEMTENLVQKYMTMSPTIPDKVVDNYDINSGGHGSIKFLPKM